MSLAGVDFEQDLLSEKLASLSSLEYLGLKVDWSNGDDFHWLLAPKLAKHPRLLSLGLGDIPINRAGYQTLISLLSNNYRIKKN